MSKKFQIFYYILASLMNEYLPWTYIKIPAGSKPWVTEYFIDTLKLRNKHWRDGNTVLYTHYKKKTENIKNSLKTNYVMKNLSRVEDSKK